MAARRHRPQSECPPRHQCEGPQTIRQGVPEEVNPAPRKVIFAAGPRRASDGNACRDAHGRVMTLGSLATRNVPRALKTVGFVSLRYPR